MIAASVYKFDHAVSSTHNSARTVYGGHSFGVVRQVLDQGGQTLIPGNLIQCVIGRVVQLRLAGAVKHAGHVEFVEVAAHGPFHGQAESPAVRTGGGGDDGWAGLVEFRAAVGLMIVMGECFQRGSRLHGRQALAQAEGDGVVQSPAWATAREMPAPGPAQKATTVHARTNRGNELPYSNFINWDNRLSEQEASPHSPEEAAPEGGTVNGFGWVMFVRGAGEIVPASIQTIRESP